MTQEPRDQWRLYSIVNGLYMKEIQWGIQTTHGVSTMMIDISDKLLMQLTRAPNVGAVQREAELNALMDMYLKVQEWATKCPTVIVCDGVNVAGLNKAWETMEFFASGIGLPIAKFHEDADSLGGVITNVVVLVPRNLFMATPVMGEDGALRGYTLENGSLVTGESSGKTKWTFHFLEYLKQLRLAR